MGFLANSASLLKDATFRDLITAACAYQARLVMLEADTINKHAVRLALAKEVLLDPMILTARMIIIVATDKTISEQSANPLSISEDDILAKVAGAWTKVSEMQHPELIVV